jgi:peptide deformylase
MKILEYPNEHLRTKARPVEKVTPEMVETAKEMYRVMRAANGIGLAANQVGLDMSLIVIENNGHMLAMFNPVILYKSPDTEYAAESCLSFKNVIRMIKRSRHVKVKYRDVNNKMQYGTFIGLQARCISHEHDHLFSRLFIDHEERPND